MLSFLGFIENQPEIKTKTSTATMPIPCCAILPPRATDCFAQLHYQACQMPRKKSAKATP